MNNRLQQFLELENISPARLADTLGVQRSRLSHILSGRNKPGYDFFIKLLTKFPHINSEWLLMGKGKPYKEMQMMQGGNATLPSSQNSGNSVYGKNGISGSSDFAGNRIQYNSILYDSIQNDSIPYNNLQHTDVLDNSIQNNGLQNGGVLYNGSQGADFPSSEDFEGIFPDTSDARTAQNSTYNSDNQNNTPQNSRFEPSENRVNGQNRADGGKKRKIKRVIIFYSDGSFEELFPHIG